MLCVRLILLLAVAVSAAVLSTYSSASLWSIASDESIDVVLDMNGFGMGLSNLPTSLDIIPFHNYIAWATSNTSAYVESVTFTKQPNQTTAVSNLLSGNIDMYYIPLSRSEIQRVQDAGHDLYDESATGTAYLMYVNPTNDTTHGFNMFADRNARYALNFMIDRDHIIKNMLGSGAPILSTLRPSDPDYLHVYRDLAALEISYNLTRAEQLITQSLESSGATKDAMGMWSYDDQPVTVTIVIREDDVVRHQIGDDLADVLEGMGVTVERTYIIRQQVSGIIHDTDPADQKWHLYTQAFIRGVSPEYDDTTLAQYYGPWAGGLPGKNIEGYWSYKHEHLDDLTQTLYSAEYASLDERAHIIKQATHIGVTEAVKVMIAVGYESYAVRSGVAGVVNTPFTYTSDAVQYGGITSKYTPLNVQLINDTNLAIGDRHVTQGSWNLVGGFDFYSGRIWNLLSDAPFVRHPHNLDLLDGRNVIISIETAGPEGNLTIHHDAVMWDPNATLWAYPNKTSATSKVVFDIRFSNWHHNQPMDINDVLYRIAFDEERRITQNVSSGIHPVAVRVLDADTIEVYVDYWNEDTRNIADSAAVWAKLPWEMFFAMQQLVDSDQADWTSIDATKNSDNWLDMLDNDDVVLVRKILAGFQDASNEHHLPYFLYANSSDSAYVTARYDAAISWLDAKGHMVISNGPFYLYDVVRSADNNIITQMTLKRFDDPTYPYARGYWGMFEGSAPLSENITIGSLIPLTGSLRQYGYEAQAASAIALAEFNEYLAVRGEEWRLDMVQYDTGSDPLTTLSALESLNEQGIKLVNGPVLDMLDDEAMTYTIDNDMSIMACCPYVPPNILGDSLFRLLPDQGAHTNSIIEIATANTMKSPMYVVPVGINNSWAVELLEAYGPGFEAQGVEFTDVVVYNPDDIPSGVGALAERVHNILSNPINNGSDMIVVYVGFDEVSEFFKEASTHDILDDVRWFAAGQNTVLPDIDNTAAAFAAKVKFTLTQPSILYHDGVTAYTHLESQGIDDPSVYATHAYDGIWVLGLSILAANSSDAADVSAEIRPITMRYVAPIGPFVYADLSDAAYQTWLFGESSDTNTIGWMLLNTTADPNA